MRKGFTLTELMVALSVIGIIVAVVTPAIVKNRPNKNKMLIKKSYYATEQIVNSLINDDSLYPDMTSYCEDVNLPTDDNNYCAWGFDYTATGKLDGVEYSGNTKFADLFKERLNIKSEDAENNTFITNDGIKWDVSDTIGAWTARSGDAEANVGTFDSQDSHTPGVGKIVIDVNKDDSQECTQESGDCSLYEIQILANGKMRVKPEHTKAIEYISNTSIKND